LLKLTVDIAPQLNATDGKRRVRDGDIDALQPPGLTSHQERCITYHSSYMWLNYAELSMAARAGGIKTE
jgi:hypothetical protein